jgi:hypothetical protein
MIFYRRAGDGRVVAVPQKLGNHVVPIAVGIVPESGGAVHGVARLPIAIGLGGGVNGLGVIIVLYLADATALVLFSSLFFSEDCCILNGIRVVRVLR